MRMLAVVYVHWLYGGHNLLYLARVFEEDNYNSVRGIRLCFF